MKNTAGRWACAGDQRSWSIISAQQAENENFENENFAACPSGDMVNNQFGVTSDGNGCDSRGTRSMQAKDESTVPLVQIYMYPFVAITAAACSNGVPGL